MTPHAAPSTTPEQAPSNSSAKRPSLNAYRHGLTAQVLILTPEEQPVYARHCATLRAHYKPQGPVESQLVQSIADSQWRLNRAFAIEESIFARGITHSTAESTGNPEVDAAFSYGRSWLAEGKQIALLTLYEQRIHRKMQTDRQSLAEEQSRRREHETETHPPQPAAQAANPMHPHPVLVCSPAPAPTPDILETPPQRRAA